MKWNIDKTPRTWWWWRRCCWRGGGGGDQERTAWAWIRCWWLPPSCSAARRRRDDGFERQQRCHFWTEAISKVTWMLLRAIDDGGKWMISTFPFWKEKDKIPCRIFNFHKAAWSNCDNFWLTLLFHLKRFLRRHPVKVPLNLCLRCYQDSACM